MARAVVIAACAAAVTATIACASRLGTPVSAAHPTADCATAVPSPPPEPVQIDHVTRPDDPRQVWVDGQWLWKNRRWTWEPGSWQLPPAGAYYARPALIRIPVAVYGDGDGGDARVLKGYAMALMAYPGHWHLPNGTVVSAPEQTRAPHDAGSSVGSSP